MSLPDELLGTARHLARRNQNRPTQADLRRSVSTAYYALFHRLIDAATVRLLPTPGQQALIARAFEHGRMKGLCQRIVRLAGTARRPEPATDLFTLSVLLGWPVPAELGQVADAFTDLQERRHQADYDRAAPDLVRGGVQAVVAAAEAAFADLAAVEDTPAGRACLLLLLIGEPKAR